MDNAFDELTRALHQARDLNRAIDKQANDLADLLDGRLRHVSPYRLKRLKQQLAQFNARTHTWMGD